MNMQVTSWVSKFHAKMGNETIRQMKTILRHAAEQPVEKWQKANGPAYIFHENRLYPLPRSEFASNSARKVL